MISSGENCAVKIAVRERPSKDVEGSASVINYPSVNNILIVDERPFAFDHVLSPSVTQEQLFDDLVKPLVGKVLQGYNCTALAYGQTGTGKSYTMGLNSNNFEGDNVGVVPRCLKELVLNAQGISDENVEVPSEQREIKAAFIEIYNEKVYDLLAENSTEPIVARGYKYTGGTRKPITSVQECYSILAQGNKNRHVRPTKMNTQSSRSHAIFTIHVNFIKDDKPIVACLNLVDLAGSEGVRRTGHQGVAMSEGVNINQGLLSIGKVLQAITMGHKVIPYRDSVLSSVLQDSLNPNSFLTLLACISPHRVDMSETLSTLRFAQNAKQLKHTPQINTILAEIKKNKVKTPYKLHTLHGKNVPFAAATPNKRPYSVMTPAAKSVVKKPLRNTFCTPNKLRRIETQKFNRTEFGSTTASKEKQNQLLGDFMQPPSLPPKYTGSELRQETSFEGHCNSTIDLRSSIFSLNISTSTTVDAPTNKTSNGVNSYSPIIRKCMNEFEKIVDVKMSKMMESLRGTVHNNQPPPDTTAATSTLLATPAQLNSKNIRQELRSIVCELLNSSEALEPKSVISTIEKMPHAITPVAQNAKCQLFTTSSPVFKVPVIPAASDKHSEINNSSTFMSLSGDNMTALNLTDSDCFIREHNEQTAVPNIASAAVSRRYSKRLSVARKLNESMATDESSLAVMNASHRHSRRLTSIKEIHDQRRRSIRLAMHTPPQPKQMNKKTKAPALNNSVIASYFNAASGAKSTSKKQNVAKHKKAILDLLNTGSIKELQVLPQVGQKTAFQIITQRTLNGKFKSIIQVEKLPIWRGSGWERFAQANMLI